MLEQIFFWDLLPFVGWSVSKERRRPQCHWWSRTRWGVPWFPQQDRGRRWTWPSRPARSRRRWPCQSRSGLASVWRGAAPHLKEKALTGGKCWAKTHQRGMMLLQNWIWNWEAFFSCVSYILSQVLKTCGLLQNPVVHSYQVFVPPYPPVKPRHLHRSPHSWHCSQGYGRNVAQYRPFLRVNTCSHPNRNHLSIK